ncbi:hypothetical protein JCM3766R1_000491 [Sporobolomyces carnicolor]
MSTPSLDQLRALRTQLDEVIQAVSTSQIDLPDLDESCPITSDSAAQPPQLARLAAALHQVTALVEARVLRLLASQYIFREVEPGVFARNRLSAVLDTGKDVQALRADSTNAFVGTNGLAAMVSFNADVGLKSAAHLSDVLLDEKLSSSYAPTDASFASAFGGGQLFAYLSRNEGLMKRFAASMEVLKWVSPQGEALTTGSPWTSLPEGSVVVDVGGGTGQLCLEIGTKVPHLEFVIQDLPDVIEKATTEFWKSPAAAKVRDRVTMQSHNFLAPQPVKGAHYVLRAIIHAWPDAEAIKILQHLADAADKDSKLVVINQSLVELSPPNRFPPVATLPYYTDIQTMACMNSQERTEAQYAALAEKAGWKLVHTWKTGPNGEDGAWRHYEFTRRD